MRLRDDVTDEQAQRAGTMAVTAKEGKAYTSTSGICIMLLLERNWKVNPMHK